MYCQISSGSQGLSSSSFSLHNLSPTYERKPQSTNRTPNKSANKICTHVKSTVTKCVRERTRTCMCVRVRACILRTSKAVKTAFRAHGRHLQCDWRVQNNDIGLNDFKCVTTSRCLVTISSLASPIRCVCVSSWYANSKQYRRYTNNVMTPNCIVSTPAYNLTTASKTCTRGSMLSNMKTHFQSDTVNKTQC